MKAPLKAVIQKNWFVHQVELIWNTLVCWQEKLELDKFDGTLWWQKSKKLKEHLVFL